MTTPLSSASDPTRERAGRVAPTAIILAGGLGTRMGPLTRRQPKHLLEVAGEPFLAHQLQWLASHGVRDVVLATSYLAEQFAAALGDGRRWGVRLRCSTEDVPQGTGGGLVVAARLLRPDPEALVVVVNGDLLTRHDLGRQLLLATRSEAPAPDAVLHIRTVPDARAFGCVVADKAGRVIEFVEKSSNPPTHEVNAGTYVLRHSAIEAIPPGVVSLEHDVLPGLVARGRVLAYREQAMWEDIGNPAALVRASRALVDLSGRKAHVDDTAIVDSSAQLSDGAAIGPRAVVAAGAVVRGSVVMRDAHIGARATMSNCVVAPGGSVAAGAVLADAVVT